MYGRGLVINFSNLSLNNKGTYRETASLKMETWQDTVLIVKISFRLKYKLLSICM